jgi:Fe-Mn family superoxide dismutase
MDKRTFLKLSGVAAAGVILAPTLASCQAETTDFSIRPGADGDFVLPELPYAFAALEPQIDALTMEIHHGKHHAAYVANLNKALKEKEALRGKRLEALLAEIGPDDKALRNNGGGHWNHSLFWATLKAGGSAPAGAFAAALDEAFGSLEEFQKQFKDAALKVFGSGWAWLVKSGEGKLAIQSTPNQDNPLMKNIVAQAATPLLGLDVWEHAYYLNYQNRRAEYIDGFLSLIHWEEVARRWQG